MDEAQGSMPKFQVMAGTGFWPRQKGRTGSVIRIRTQNGVTGSLTGRHRRLSSFIFLHGKAKCLVNPQILIITCAICDSFNIGKYGGWRFHAGNAGARRCGGQRGLSREIEREVLGGFVSITEEPWCGYLGVFGAVYGRSLLTMGIHQAVV